MTPISHSITIYVDVTFTFFFVLRDPIAFVDDFTVNTTTDRIILGGSHTMVAGEPVRFAALDAGLLPTPLSSNTDYYVSTVVSGTDFTISETYGGVPLDISTAGTGTFICFNYPPIDLTGWSVWSHVRTVPGGTLAFDLAPAIDGDPTTGKIDLSKTDEQTATYEAGNYQWDLLVEDDSGQILGPVFAGNLQVRQPITEPS